MINIQNENLAKYVMFKLDKIENVFTQEELASLTELVVNPVDIINESTPINLDILVYFKGLQNIELVNLFIENKDIKTLQNLPNLKSVTFEACKFEDFEMVTQLSITSLEIINCQQSIDGVYTMSNLKSLSILNNQIVVEELNKLTNLEYLQISFCDVLDNQTINIASLQELYLDNTNIKNLNFVSTLTNLKKLSISQDQYDENKDLMQNLMQNGVVVMLENMVNFKDLGGYNG